MLKRAGTIALAVFLVVAAVLGFAPGSAAAENTGDIGFYVRAILPENQIDDNLTYFDLRVSPGDAQQLEVEVVNESGKTITVEIAAISASTNRNGVIDYKTPDIRDKTLLNPFSQLAQVQTPSLTIPAGETATARVAVTMPQQEYDGVVLGSLVFTRAPDQGGEQQGMTIQNVYSYVIGVKLTETDVAIAPDFEIESIEAETVNYQPAMVHYIRNTQATIVKDMDLHVVVTNAAGKVVADVERFGVDMAPNSVMPLAITPLTDSGGSELAPGDYTSNVTLQTGGESWTFEQKFTIGGVQADNINNESILAEKPAIERWVMILLIAAAIIIIALLIIVILMTRRNRDKNRWK